MRTTPLIPLYLAVFGTSALAQNYYQEKITLGTDRTVFQANTPHSTPAEHVYANNSANQGPANLVKVVFASDPAPSVSARAEATMQANQVSRANVDAFLSYSFAVDGPANSYVPLHFRGLFSLSNDSFLSGANAQVYLSASTPDNQRVESVGMWALCDGSSVGPRCLADLNVGGRTTYSSIQASMSPVQMGSHTGGGSTSGSFQGVLFAATDATGHGRGLVSLLAHANAAAAWGNGTTEMSSAFIDPELRIAPAYLALNPTASLRLTPGVGNEITAVSEPGAAALMCGGLAGLLVLARRRRAAASISA